MNSRKSIIMFENSKGFSSHHFLPFLVEIASREEGRRKEIRSFPNLPFFFEAMRENTSCETQVPLHPCN